MNIGILGGTFDPVHKGHIAIAEKARAKLNLTQVLFIPVGQPWLKQDSAVSAAEHRVEMVRLAIAGSPYFKLSTVEVERPGPSYIVDTITELQAQLGAGDEFYFIMGWDNLAQLPRWKEPTRLIEMCHLVAMPRPGYQMPEVSLLEAAIPGLSRRLIVLDEPRVDISASEIRQRVARGLPIPRLVPETVEKYIRQHKLYVKY